MWPESSTPFFFEDDGVATERMRALAREPACRFCSAAINFYGARTTAAA